MELFDLPAQRLGQDTHDAVFGDLPTRLSAALHTPETGDLVLQLLDRGWRAGQLSSRIGALPAGPDPEAEVIALLRGFLDQVPPDARWRQERSEREAVARSTSRAEAPASEESRQRWISQIRSEPGGPRAPRAQPLLRVRPPCSLCGAESEFFVTRAARLCSACVELLESGAATVPGPGLSEAG